MLPDYADPSKFLEQFCKNRARITQVLGRCNLRIDLSCIVNNHRSPFTVVLIVDPVAIFIRANGRVFMINWDLPPLLATALGSPTS